MREERVRREGEKKGCEKDMERGAKGGERSISGTFLPCGLGTAILQLLKASKPAFCSPHPG